MKKQVILTNAIISAFPFDFFILTAALEEKYDLREKQIKHLARQIFTGFVLTYLFLL